MHCQPVQKMAARVETFLRRKGVSIAAVRNPNVTAVSAVPDAAKESYRSSGVSRGCDLETKGASHSIGPPRN